MQKPKHILVIRLSAMGDVAMTVPVLASMAKSYPDVKITLLTRKFFAPLFKGIPNVEIYEADVKGRHKGVPGLKKLADELRLKQIEAVADLHNVLRSKILKSFFRFYGVPVKQIDKGRQEKKELTRAKKKNFRSLKSTHQRYAEVFEAFGFPIELSGFKGLEKEKLSPKLMELVGNEPHKWLGIAPFAQHESKVYPLDLMKKLLQRLEALENIKVFLFGGGDREKAILSQWEKEFGNVVNIAGKCTFQEELALISNLDAMISMDSGNGHMAANFAVPVITLWGLTHPYTGFAPFNQPETNRLYPDLEKYPLIPTSVYGTKIPPGYEDAMRTISPETVLGKVKEVLDLTKEN